MKAVTTRRTTRLGCRGRLLLAALALSPMGCGGSVREAAAAPQAGPAGAASPTVAQPALLDVRQAEHKPGGPGAPGGQSAAPGAAAKAAVALAAEGEAMRADLEALDARVQEGLSRLAEFMQTFEADRRQWTAMDRSVAAAREVNRAVGARNKAIVGIYDQQVSGPLAHFEEKLKAAPGVYRRMAAERREFQAAATLDIERRSYLAMAELCESAAVLCERRHEELFGAAGPETGFAARPRPRNAATLSETIGNMRRLSLVHDRWEETFAAYPSSLDDGKLTALFDHLSAYAEDLDAFTKGVEALKDAMKKKAVEPAPTPAAPKPPAGRPKDSAAVLSYRQAQDRARVAMALAPEFRPQR